MIWKWRTFTGKEVTDETIDHQHLSNIFWYSKLVNPNLGRTTLRSLQETLNDRFNGQVLPYRPHVKNSDELEILEKDGYLRWLPNGDGDIMYEGQLIGEIKIFNF